MSSRNRLARHRVLRDAVERLQAITEEATKLVDEIAVRTRYDGLSIREGIRRCLGDNDAPVRGEDIASKLWLGGVHTQSDDRERLIANVRSTLHAMKRNREVRVTMLGWQLRKQ